MSELIQTTKSGACIRRNLFAGVSLLALTIQASPCAAARAEDNEQPSVWIEVGGQLSRVLNEQELYSPDFLTLEPSNFSSPLGVQGPPRRSLEGIGAVVVQPKDMDWSFTASIRYGRSSGKKQLHQQTYPHAQNKYQTLGTIVHTQTRMPFAARFIDSKSKSSETHTILDFAAGRDVGLGLFGRGATSTIGLGVRFAQFTSRAQTTLNENPDWHFVVKQYSYSFYGFQYRFQSVHQPYHSYAGQFAAERSFHGVGPSLSWKGATPLAGNDADEVLTFDWGVNASLLFGRQKAHTHHQTTALYHPSGLGLLGGNNPGARTTRYRGPITPDHTRSHSVIVPNVGGFAGLSFRYSDAKVSFGYRADFFFGAMDTGIDNRRTSDLGFHGPFATISIGLGG